MNRCWSRLPHLTLRLHPPERYFDRSKNILDWDKNLVSDVSQFWFILSQDSVPLPACQVWYYMSSMWSSHSHWTSYDLVIQHLLWQLWSSSDGFVPDNREVGFAGKVLSHCDLGEVAHDLCTLHYEWWDRGIYRVKLALQIWIPWCLCSGQHATFLREQKWFLLDAEYTPQGRTWRSIFC